MTRTRAIAGSFLAALMLTYDAIPALGAVQQRDQPAATMAKPRAEGTATLSGSVTLAADSEIPVGRAVVSLVSIDGKDARSVVTDDGGRFGFLALPEGRYTLTAEKPAHISTSFGAKRPGRPGTAVTLTAGQSLTGLRIALPRGGVVAGTLRMANGDPLPDTPVIAIPVAEASAGGRYLGSLNFSTDDRGAYRIFGLPPGEYIVGALPAAGRGEVAVRSDAEYDAAVRDLAARTGRSGVAVSAPPAAAKPIGVAGFAPTYFPGTPIAQDALRVVVGIGEVKDGIDIIVTMFPMGTILGVTLDSDGQPRRAVQLTADAIGPPLPLGVTSSVRTTVSDDNGRFAITGVPPGRYRVTARGSSVVVGPGDQLRPADSAPTPEWASTQIQVGGDNVDGLSLRLQPGLTFEGMLIAAGSGGGPESWKGAALTLRPVGTSGHNVVINRSPLTTVTPRSGPVRPDGVFRITGIQPGNYEIALQLPPTEGKGWTVRSIRSAGRDLRDAPLTFELGSISEVLIELTNQGTEVSGTLWGADGVPASDYYVVIFSAERGLWHPTSPRVQVVRPGMDGAFVARGLPAGDYWLAALTDVDDDEWKTTAFLESLLVVSIPIVVKDRGTTRQDIRIR